MALLILIRHCCPVSGSGAPEEVCQRLIAAALLLSKLMAGMLYGVQPTDPTTFGGVAIVLSLTALTAICVPARRATRIEQTPFPRERSR